MTIIKELEKYLRETLGIEIRAKSWIGERDLPFFLRELYVFYEIALLRRPCVVIVPRGNIEITSSTLAKHFKQLQAKWTGLCIYIRAAISSYTRRRLIEDHIPFAIPYNQMYLPDMGIDFREHFLKERTNIKILSPATQAVIIYALTHNKPTSTPSELANELHYTSMTMTRALDELESLGIGEISHQGKERRVYFTDNKKAFWEKVKPFLGNPIKKHIWLRQNSKNREIIEKGFVSGLTALARLTMLNQPLHPVYAIDMKEWKKSGIEELPSAEEADVQLELWSYNPKLFEENGFVDPFSLYLSLRDSQDERIETALEKLIEEELR